MDIREKYKNARAFIVLLAALITWLLNMKYKRNIVESLIILLIVIVVFYMIASIAIKLMDKIRNMEEGKPVDLAIEEEPLDEEHDGDVQKDTQ